MTKWHYGQQLRVEKNPEKIQGKKQSNIAEQNCITKWQENKRCDLGENEKEVITELWAEMIDEYCPRSRDSMGVWGKYI